MKSEFIAKNVNGLDCYIVKKKGFKQKQCMLAVNYGSKDNVFECGGREYRLPQGIAHFLEHKIFADEKNNVFELFGKIGASVNAFTNFNSTVYYFNCTDNFGKGMKILADMLNTPYFTDDNVESEKSIICQEIKMYEDDPMWCIYFNMLSLLYRNNSVKNNIAGTEESVNGTVKDDLYQCYESFYNRKNSALICCGDIDESQVYECAEMFFENNEIKATRVTDDVILKASERFIEKKMDTKRKIFNIGFNDVGFSKDTVFSAISARLVLDIICGKASEFYEDMCNNLILDSTFASEYNCTKGLGFYYLSGFSDEPSRVLDKFLESIGKIRKEGIADSVFEAAKKSYLGKTIRELDNLYNIMVTQADLYSKGADISMLFEKLKNISKNDILERLEGFAGNREYVMSLVKPF